MARRSLLAPLLLALFACPALAREPMQAGRWEVTVTVKAAGVSVPPTSQTECLSQAEVNPDVFGDLAQGSCRATHVRRTDDGVTWDLECAEGKGRGELHVVSPTQYGGAMTLDVGGTAVEATVEARRVGGC